MKTNKQIPAELQQLLDAAAKQLAGVQVTPELITKSFEQNLEEGKKTTMKITKANIKQLVAESIGDIFNENVDLPELGSETVAEQNTDKFIELMAEKAASGALNAILDAVDRDPNLKNAMRIDDYATFTNDFKKDIKNLTKAKLERLFNFRRQR
jgi:hypothetical protein